MNIIEEVRQAWGWTGLEPAEIVDGAKVRLKITE